MEICGRQTNLRNSVTIKTLPTSIFLWILDTLRLEWWNLGNENIKIIFHFLGWASNPQPVASVKSHAYVPAPRLGSIFVCIYKFVILNILLNNMYIKDGNESVFIHLLRKSYLVYYYLNNFLTTLNHVGNYYMYIFIVYLMCVIYIFQYWYISIFHLYIYIYIRLIEFIYFVVSIRI